MAEVLASAVVLVGAVVIWCTDLPRDSVARRLAQPLLRPARWLGLGHSWRLFAPRPTRGETRLTLEVTRVDRSYVAIPFPPPSLCRHGRPLSGIRKLGRNLLVPARKGLRASFVRYVVAHDLGPGPPALTVRFRVEHRDPAPLDDLDAPPARLRTTRPFFVDLG